MEDFFLPAFWSPERMNCCCEPVPQHAAALAGNIPLERKANNKGHAAAPHCCASTSKKGARCIPPSVALV